MSGRSGRRVALVSFALLAAAFHSTAQNQSVTVTIDASANRHAINANIYGVAYGDATTLPDLNCPINRYGGNNSSRYNWQLNADNRGQDWFFESIGDTSATAGERGDTFFSISRAAGAQAMLTVPIIGWVGKLGANRNKLSSFSIAKYGAQTGNDWQWFPDAGNGVLTSNGQDVTGNDPNDANVPADSTFQQGWIQHLMATWGKAVNGGVGYYLLDNEHSIWFSTHRDVHPTGPTMDEVKNKIIDYSAKIKAVDPTAQVVGPEEWGWSGYFYSGYDQQWGSQHGWSSFPDRANHGGQDYLPWLLAQLKQSAVSTGQRPLDVFSAHYYPQGGEFGNDTSTPMQLRRNRSTRSLWDPNYVDETWINDKVQLIPRLKSWVSTYYFAGTPVAITEYNWGAESHINGATTQADILGIFGREGLDLAARWTTPDPSTPTYKAMKLYRNYDGSKSTFGDTSVSAAVANPDNLSAFAAVRSSDGALTVMVISKVLSGGTPVTLALNNFSGNGTAQLYQLTAANSIQHLSDITYSGTSVGITAPAQSITLLILPKSAALPPLLSVNKTHTGNFTPGQQNASYTVTVSNTANAGPTSGPVTVTETAPSGLTLVSMSGTGWTCPSTCTRSDALAAGSSYPPITVTVNVASNATSPQVNQVSVSGGESAGASASDSTAIVSAPVLSISKTHTGSFTRGQPNATYTVTVSNANGAGATNGTATVTETAPSGMTLVSMAGTGWTCGSTTCSRSDALAGGSSYPPITVTVNVAGNATSPQLNQVSVSGGGSVMANSSDSTVITGANLIDQSWVASTGNDGNICDRSSPCRTFQGAHDKTSPGGSIKVVDAADYSPVTINKAITIDGGGVAIIAVASGTAITVNAGGSDKVVLRNLSVNGLGGGGVGIQYNSGPALRVENVAITKFSGAGGEGMLVSTSAFAVLTIENTTITDCNAAGISVSSSSIVATELDHVRIWSCGTGVAASNGARITLRNSGLSLNSAAGVALTQSGQGSEVDIDSTTMNYNGKGVQAVGASTVARITHNVIMNNGTGLSPESGGQIISAGDNTLVGNTTNGTPTSTLSKR